MTVPPEEVRFSANASILFNALKDSVLRLNGKGYNIDLTVLSMIAETVKVFDNHYSIQEFISRSHEYWDKIHERDITFFANDAPKAFSYLPVESVNVFRLIFTAQDEVKNDIIDVEAREQLWTLISSMVKISIKYIHTHRNPSSFVDNGKLISRYECSFFDQVDIGRHANTWKLELSWPLRD